ncbi:angiogenic factor with G patch and FHA domains 1-like isoform X5 [Limulus polyphemus]|uniref:Angiogenic factor with G patch and FHA domains 1-like isoform X4 n=1 Tax=Limulus polyphemus TaxID=6850 RepID=A0ABM1SYB0_LIMPO|nr:angiogenic factor with G patch and FHA domains 1-like isoform X4 [Limulus polyphemus]XP_022248616.1 angiogenic factor with G patch and FHA domains 1-like isoform X5 [Limulus polyphemus]
MIYITIITLNDFKKMEENPSGVILTLQKDEIDSNEMEVIKLKKELARVEAVCERYERYNEDLQQQVEKMSCQLQEWRQKILGERNCAENQTEMKTPSLKKLCLNGDSSPCLCPCHLKEISLLDVSTQTFESDFMGIDEQGSVEDWTLPEGSRASVADLVKQAASEALQSSEYVYDINSSMYYSINTGYYYDPVSTLFYEPYSGSYYMYDEATKSYHFHSQVALSEHEASHKRHHQISHKIAPSGEGNSHSEETDNTSNQKLHSEMSEMTHRYLQTNYRKRTRKKCDEVSEITSALSSLTVHCMKETVIEQCDSLPPCIRLIVVNSENLLEGSLLMVTCTGATVGREEKNGLCIPDSSVSKEHAEISFEEIHERYMIRDLGSQNGTFINFIRLSEPKQPSDLHPLNHGDELKIGNSTLLIHIHQNKETCDECEPGLVQAALAAQKSTLKDRWIIKSKEEKEKERRKELKELKRKFGLERSSYQMKQSNTVEKLGYQDRAEHRRKTKGSDNPHEKDATPASMDQPLPPENKGFQLLKKMGWSEGQSLGKCQTGKTEPIQIQMRNSKVGLGATSVSFTTKPTNKTKHWKKAQQRFLELAEDHASP